MSSPFEKFIGKEVDALSPLKQAAVAMHEIMLSYVEAGFTREEAFDIIKSINVEMFKSAGNGGS